MYNLWQGLGKMPSKNCIIRCHVRTRFVLLLLIALHTSNNLCVIYWSKVLYSTILWHVTMELEPFWSRIWTFDMYVCIFDAVQDFLIKLGIKPCLHILKISIFSLNLPKLWTAPTKIRHIFRKQSTLKSFQKISFLKVDLLV